MGRKQLALVAAACGVIAAFGALLPWVTVEFVVTQTASGVDSAKGVFVLLLGLLGGAAAAVVGLGKTGQLLKLDEVQHLYIAIAALGLAFLLAVTSFFGNQFAGVELQGERLDFVSRGIGLWLSLLGSLGGGVAAFLATRKPAVGASTPPPPAS
jgi:hypothetical protein